MLEDGSVIESAFYYIPSGNETLYAVWSDYYTVTFDGAGGELNYQGSYRVNKVAVGGSLYFGHLKAGYSDHSRLFLGWTEEGKEELLEDQRYYVPRSDITLTAKWADAAELTFDAGVGYFRVEYEGYYSWEADGQGDPLMESVLAYRKMNSLTFRFPQGYSLFEAAEKEYNTDPYYCDLDGSYSFDAYYGVDEHGYDTIEYLSFRTPEADDKALIFTGWSLPDGSFITKDDLKTFVPDGDTTLTAVWKKPVESLALSETSITLNTGETAVLKKIVRPGDATDKRVSWKSSNTKAATVDSKGNVKAVAKGTATITATTKDGSRLSASCTVTVKQPVTKLTLNKTSLTLMRNKTFALTATAAPSNANNRAVSWKSSNTKAATVDSKGNVKAVAKGTATITAAAKDGSGVKTVCKVTVTQPVTKITLNKTSLTLNRGKTFTMKAKVGPSSANNKAVRWTTSNKEVATVTSKGVVKAVKKGTATITAAARDGSGKKAVCKITVRQPVTGLKINKTALTVTKGKTAALKVTVSPSNANNKTLKWTTSNKAVATVTSKGVVKGIKKGTATITATAADGSKKKVTCKVTVK